MLITVSGMVGSGKSTTARSVVAQLAEAGLDPECLRFRYLKLFAFGRPERPRSEHDNADGVGPTLRGRGFSLRRLTASRAIGYAARILAFRLSGIGGASRCHVVDRYFYDNLVQYGLTSWRERRYASVLRWLMPTPDLAILVLASVETIAVRRPNYAREYLATINLRYRTLQQLFPHLVAVNTDPGSDAMRQTQRAVERLVDGRRQF